MPKRGTMLLRNSRVLPLLLIVLTFLHSAVLAQGPSSTDQQPSQSPQSSSQPSKGQTSTPEASPSPNQKAPSQDSQSQADKSQSQDQGQADNGVFVFKKEVEEVMLQATVADDK